MGLLNGSWLWEVVSDKPPVFIWLTLVVLAYVFIIHPALFSQLSSIPNAHWSVPYSSGWILWVRYTNHENREIHAAHLENGPIVRVAPNEISIKTVNDGIRTVYSGGFEKGDWYGIFNNYGVPNMFSTFHSRPHSSRKRIISNSYSKSTVQTSSEFMAQAKTILYSRLLPIFQASTHSTQKPQGIDVYGLFAATAMDFVTAYQFGLRHSTNFLQNVAYRDHWLSLYHSRHAYTFFSQEVPRLTRALQTIGIRLVPRWVDWANQEIEDHCASMCSAATLSLQSKPSAIENAGDEPVVLKALMSGLEKEGAANGKASSVYDSQSKNQDLFVASEMLDQLAAGQDTTGITLTYLTWHLSRDLVLQEALRAELLTLDQPIRYPIATGAAKIDALPLPSGKQLDSLPLLHSIVMETLRLNAAIPGQQPRVTPYPSCQLAGYTIPGGFRVAARGWSLHRNVKVFPYPDVWDYTRWLNEPTNDADVLESRKERDRWFWPFSSGGRMCIGSNFAVNEIKLVAAAIYSNYTTHIVNDDGIQQMDGYVCAPTSQRLILRFEQVEHIP